MATTWRVCICVALAAWLAACGGGGGGDSGGGNAVPPADPQATHRVGAAGATIASKDGSLTLVIPAGALGNDTDITITEVSATNLPERLKPLAGALVYRLEPDGLRFAQPVAATVALPAGNSPAVMILDSNGTPEAAGGQRLTQVGTARTMQGTIAHFSLLIVETLGSVTLEFSVDRRQLSVGGMLTATAVLSKTDSEDQVRVSGAIPVHNGPFNRSGELDLIRGRTLPRSEARRLIDFYELQCVQPGGRGTAGVEILLSDLSLASHTIVYRNELVEIGQISLDRRLDPDLDIVCDGGPSPLVEILTGLFNLPDDSAPDGMTLLTGPIADLPASTAPYLGLALRFGFVAKDTKTGLTALDMTPGSADGGLGGQNLGVEALTDRPGGPDADAALLAYDGIHYNLRRWDTISRQWGFTLVGINTPVLDASRLADDRLVMAAQAGGMQFVGPHPTQGFAVDPGQAVTQAQLGCAPTSVTHPFGTVAEILAVICRRSGTTPSDVVGVVDRRGGTLWNQLFELPAGTARRIRCTNAGITTPDTAICGVTAGSKLHGFTLKVGATWSPQAREELSVGAGALGLHFNLRANGLPRLAVASFDDSRVDAVDFDGAGNRTATSRVTLPAGIDKTPHAVGFTHGGRNYIAVTGNASNNYAVVEKP